MIYKINAKGAKSPSSNFLKAEIDISIPLLYTVRYKK